MTHLLDEPDRLIGRPAAVGMFNRVDDDLPGLEVDEDERVERGHASCTVEESASNE